MKTHRCSKSLQNQISIRLFTTAWWLQKHEHDWDCDAHYLRTICPIVFCPFCGKKLESEVQA